MYLSLIFSSPTVAAYIYLSPRVRFKEVYDISHNNVTGTISTTVGSVQDLEHLDWSYTGYFGTIPSSIGKLSDLETLNLGHANFTGTVPTEILKLEQLGGFPPMFVIPSL